MVKAAAPDMNRACFDDPDTTGRASVRTNGRLDGTSSGGCSAELARRGRLPGCVRLHYGGNLGPFQIH